MASSARRLAQQLLGPQLTRGFRTSGAAKGAPAPKTGGGMSHEEIVLGDGHHGFRPGYNYDWEHGPNYLRPDTIPNFHQKYAIGMPIFFAVAIGIPAFAVWWQQSKLKTS